MAHICPVCGMEHEKGEPPSRGEWIKKKNKYKVKCDCGHEFNVPFEKSEEDKKKGKNGDKKDGGLVSKIRILSPDSYRKERDIQQIIIAVVMSIFVLLTLSYAPGIRKLNSDILSVVTIFWDYAPDYWTVLTRAFNVIASILIGLILWNANSPGDAFKRSLWIAGSIGVIMGLWPYISDYMANTNADDYLRTLDSYLSCTLGNLGKDPSQWENCYMEPIDNGDDVDEELDKVGDYEVLDIRFDREVENVIYLKDDGNGNIQPDFTAFELSLLVTNPSEERTIKDFYIIEHGNTINDYSEEDTAIVRDEVKSRDKIKLANLYEKYGRCSGDEDNACDIAPGETKRLVLKAEKIECEDIEIDYICEDFRYLCEWEEDEDEGVERCINDNDRKTRVVEARVQFSYDYSAEGKYDLVIATKEGVLEELEESRSENARKGVTKYKTDGPVDVDVNFVPSSYLFQGKELDDVKPEINLRIHLSNEDTSATAYLDEKITVIRQDDGCLEPDQCTSWISDTGYVDMTEDGDLETFPVGGWPLTESQTYLCNYNIEAFCTGQGNTYPCADLKEIKDCVEHPCCKWDGSCKTSKCEDSPAVYGDYGSSCELCGCNNPGSVAHVSEDNGEYIPFIVRVDYTYEDSIKMDGIEAVELEQ